MAAMAYVAVDAARTSMNGKGSHIQTRAEQEELLRSIANQSPVAFETPVTAADGTIQMMRASMTVGENGNPVVTLHDTPTAGATVTASTEAR